MQTYWIWFSKLPGINIRQKLALLGRYGNPEQIYLACPKVAYEIPKLTQKGWDALQNPDLTQARKIMEDCKKLRVNVITYDSDYYPDRLKDIKDPPLVLYAKGRRPEWNDMPCVGMVGTRKASAYGLQVAKRIGARIAAGGAIVVSGCADGVDTASLIGACEQGEFVVGVLGCGIDVVYPAKNGACYRQVEHFGLIISEYEPGLSPMPYRFVDRNRIISGLSEAVVVIEAAEKSGSLITARNAREQGRAVYAVPGNVDNPGCAGSNALLLCGARAAIDGVEVLKDLAQSFPRINLNRPLLPSPMEKFPVCTPAHFEASDKKSIDKPAFSHYSGKEKVLPELEPDEKLVYAQLTQKGVLIDSLVGVGGMDISRVLVAITGLQIKKLAERCPGSKVRLRQ